MDIFDVAPLLKGLTFDGRKGAIVVSVPLVEAPDLTCTSGSLREQFCPDMRSVNVEGIGGFMLGSDYDDALNRTQNAPQRSGRDAVVCGKTCVVTGGAQGFGEAIVRGLVDCGALVFIADLNQERAETLAAELNRSAGRTVSIGVGVNVADEQSVQKMVNTVVQNSGGVDLFISNAGVLKAGSVKELTLKDFRFVTDVNYIGFFLCAKHVAPVMEQMNRAAPEGYYSDIIAISSKSALEGSNKNGAYAGSKFGVVGLVQSFAKELVTDNIKVNTICPGNFFDGPLWSDPDRGLFVQYLNAGKVPGAKSIADVRRFYEDQVPMKRGCNGDDVLKAILYAVEQKYETGQAIPVTGGQVMLN